MASRRVWLAHPPTHPPFDLPTGTFTALCPSSSSLETKCNASCLCSRTALGVDAAFAPHSHSADKGRKDQSPHSPPQPRNKVSYQPNLSTCTANKQLRIPQMCPDYFPFLLHFTPSPSPRMLNKRTPGPSHLRQSVLGAVLIIGRKSWSVSYLPPCPRPPRRPPRRCLSGGWRGGGGPGGSAPGPPLCRNAACLQGTAKCTTLTHSAYTFVIMSEDRQCKSSFWVHTLCPHLHTTRQTNRNRRGCSLSLNSWSKIN